jgi:hypothetical protein
VGTSLSRDEARRIAAKEPSSSVKNRKREICTSGSPRAAAPTVWRVQGGTGRRGAVAKLLTRD